MGCRQGRSCWAAAAKALAAMLSLNCIWCLLACRETNMKVRQANSVTAELGDTSQLALFDGECLQPVLCHGAAPMFCSNTVGRQGPATWHWHTAARSRSLGSQGWCWEHWDGAGHVEKASHS